MTLSQTIVVPALPKGVIDMMAERTHRMHHYLWHAVRDGWLSFSEQTREIVKAQGWEPPRPALNGDKPILDNASGEDFLYMHREMIGAVNKKLAEIRDPSYPKVEGWPAPPDLNDADYPVPPAYSVGNPDDAFIAKCKTEAFFDNTIVKWARAYTSNDFLKVTSLGELGSWGALEMIADG